MACTSSIWQHTRSHKDRLTQDAGKEKKQIKAQVKRICQERKSEKIHHKASHCTITGHSYLNALTATAGAAVASWIIRLLVFVPGEVVVNSPTLYMGSEPP